MMQIWKDIENYENYYQISNDGIVRSLSRRINSSHNSKRILVEKELTNKKCSNGKYLQVCLSKEGKISYFLVHRLVAKAFIENPLSLPEVNHIDGNRYNNIVSNLEWCTRQYNIQHAYDTGLRTPTILSREQCGLSKVTSAQVEEIINLWKNKISYKIISQKFHLSISGLEKLIKKNK